MFAEHREMWGGGGKGGERGRPVLAASKRASDRTMGNSQEGSLNSGHPWHDSETKIEEAMAKLPKQAPSNGFWGPGPGPGLSLALWAFNRNMKRPVQVTPGIDGSHSASRRLSPHGQGSGIRITKHRSAPSPLASHRRYANTTLLLHVYLQAPELRLSERGRERIILRTYIQSWPCQVAKKLQARELLLNILATSIPPALICATYRDTKTATPTATTCTLPQPSRRKGGMLGMDATCTCIAMDGRKHCHRRPWSPCTADPREGLVSDKACSPRQ